MTIWRLLAGLLLEEKLQSAHEKKQEDQKSLELILPTPLFTSLARLIHLGLIWAASLWALFSAVRVAT